MNPKNTHMNELTGCYRRYIAEERKLSLNTVLSYTRVVQEFSRYLQGKTGGQRVLEFVSEADVVAYLRLAAPGADQRARSAWNVKLSALRGFFGFLIKEGIMDKDPTQDIKRVRVRQAPADPPTLDEVLSLIDTVEERSPLAYRKRNILIVQLLFHCSLRVSELISLDLDQVRMNVDEAQGLCLLNVRRKGDKRQHIVFNDVVAVALEAYLKDRVALGAPEREQALILSDRRQRISSSSIRRMIRRYAELAGIRKGDRRVSPHSLRHASATEMERDGARPRVIQEHLGHASIQTTQRYLHTNEDEQRRAVDSIGRRFKRRRESRADAGGKVA